MKKVFKEIKLGRIQGKPFVVCFAILKTKTIKLTGCMITIEKFLNANYDYPIVVRYKEYGKGIRVNLSMEGEIERFDSSEMRIKLLNSDNLGLTFDSIDRFLRIRHRDIVLKCGTNVNMKKKKWIIYSSDYQNRRIFIFRSLSKIPETYIRGLDEYKLD
jgi:hypothetical protein